MWKPSAIGAQYRDPPKVAPLHTLGRFSRGAAKPRLMDMKTTAFLATAVSTLMLAAPALAQDAPTGTPLGGPPQRTFTPPAPPEQVEEAAPEAAPETPAAEQPAPVASRPAAKRRCSKK